MAIAVMRHESDVVEATSPEAGRVWNGAAAPDSGIVVITDASGAIQYVNPEFESAAGYSRHEVLGKRVFNLKDGTRDPAFYRALWAALCGGEAWSGAVTRRREDGAMSVEEVSIFPLCETSGDVSRYVAIKRDVTRRRQAEDSLRMAKAMERVGRLSGGIAHFLNNVLTGVIGYSDLVLNRMEAGDPRRHHVEEIRNAGNRAAVMTQRLLALSRKRLLRPKPFDLNALVTVMTGGIRKLLGENVEVLTTLAPDLGRVHADPGQVEQVLFDLVINARDAMPEGGRLTVETANVDLDGPIVRQGVPVGPGSFVMLSVSDTGVGLDDEARSRLFEPFYTTKVNGIGLGLAAVYGIVKQSGGYIWAYGRPGQGAQFTIYLPRERQAAGSGDRVRA